MVFDISHALAATLLETVFDTDLLEERQQPTRCEHGHDVVPSGYRMKTIHTIFGDIRIRRQYYYDRACKRGWCPKDRRLDIEGSSFSVGARRMMAYVGASRPFQQGREDLNALAGVTVTTKAIERESHRIGREVEHFLFQQVSDETSQKLDAVPAASPAVNAMYICMDGTGVPVVKKETEGRKGKNKEQGAKTREAKLGCVFTQSTYDAKGYPVRDDSSTSYVGAIEPVEQFGERLAGEVQRRNIQIAKAMIVVGDGAAWIWNLTEQYFRGCVEIIDLYHAREHYWTVARAMYSQSNPKLKRWTDARKKELDAGRVEAVVRAIARHHALTDEERKICNTEIQYFQKNKERMRYNVFRAKGFFVGSGVIEAGCRTLVGQRLKQSGMHWTVNGANAIIALRCCLLSNRWEDFWAYRAAA